MNVLSYLSIKCVSKLAGFIIISFEMDVLTKKIKYLQLHHKLQFLSFGF